MMNGEPIGVETDENGDAVLVEGMTFQMHPAAIPLAEAVARDFPDMSTDVLLAGVLCELRSIGTVIAAGLSGLDQVGQMMQGGMLGKLFGGGGKS